MGESCSSWRAKASKTGPAVAVGATGRLFLYILRYFKLLLTVLFLGLCASTGFAAAPDHVQFTLEGCRNNGTITLPNGSGQFVCPDNVYTTGNLGKGWNELDLVPYRIFAQTGSSSPSTQTYTIAMVVDNVNAGNPGYDLLATLTLNTALSSTSCTAPVVSAQTYATPGIGGTDTSLYRLVTITQPSNTTCVYDTYARLALGSHLYPGSSLHADLALPTTGGGITTSGIGARDVSIPVKEILPQTLRKDMTASQTGDQTWSLTKVANPTSVSFGDVCLPSAPQPQPVTITVTWTKVATTAGSTTVITHVYANNPAARIITVNVTDKIYQGTTQTNLLDTATSGAVNVPARTELLVLTHTATLPASDGAVGDFLNDVATATYTDLVTGVPVPGQTSASAQAQITAGSITNTSVTASDTESITGNGLTFAVATPSIGSFTGYTAGTQTTGPVAWSSGSQTSNGSVDFNKTITLASKQITSGVLTDTATLTGADGFTTSAGPVNVNITSSASVTLTVAKTIPAFLGTGERIEVVFHVTRASDPTFAQDVTLTFTGGGATTQHIDLTGLVPDTYTVVEGTATFFPAGSSTGTAIGFADPTGTTRVVDLTVTPTAANCSGTASYNNQLLAGPAAAQVQKITNPPLTSGDPDFTWTFTLNGPGLPIGGIPVTANAGAGFVDFGVDLQEGTFTVTETLKSGWDLTSVVPNDGTTTTICTFTVNYPQDAGVLKQCTFTNTKRGFAQVVKTASGLPLSGTQAFTFQLRQGASATAAGTILETEVASVTNAGTFTFTTRLVPGTHYQLCEVVLPGWQTSLSNDFVVFNPDADNSVLCTDFTVAAGATQSFTVNNIPPPGGLARTIGFWKNWASCKQSNGKQAPVLDQTLAISSVQVGTLTLTASDVCKAVSILNKSDVVTGKKMASNPLYGLAAQLLGAELNIVAGAGTCPAVNTAIAQANALLVKYGFNGTGTYTLTKADATLANSLASKLDAYNNNLPSACL